MRATRCIADVPDDQLDEFRACGTTAIYRPHQVVFHENAPAGGLYVLCHGTVKLYQSDRFGREHILGVAGPGDLLGELPADASKTYAASAEALTEAQLCYLPRERLLAFVERYPKVGVRIIGALSDALAAARKKAGALALKDGETRLAELLVRLARDCATAAAEGPTRVALEYTRRELAEMIGVTTETAIRLLGRLKRRGLIAVDNRELEILDVEHLQRFASRAELEAS
jgi:CRP-like cAMP-binding protein